MTSTQHVAELAVDVRRVVGYAARCGCGWRGEFRRRHHEARADAQEHNAEHRAQIEQAATRGAPTPLGWRPPTA